MMYLFIIIIISIDLRLRRHRLGHIGAKVIWLVYNCKDLIIQSSMICSMYCGLDILHFFKQTYFGYKS